MSDQRKVPEPDGNELYADPNLAQFYDLATQRRADFDYCATLATEAASVLDLGCGTGELAAELGQDRTVVGVDPAAAMLELARRRYGGGAVTWVEGDARSLRLNERFDLVLLTGHAFQVFLSAEDQQAALATIAAHLKPRGRFIFDSRNPGVQIRENKDRADTLRQLDHPQHGPVEAWNESRYDAHTQIMTYENGYRVQGTGQAFSASAQIRYTAQAELAGLIEAAGLVVETWLGDWHGHPYQADSPEIIPIGRLA